MHTLPSLRSIPCAALFFSLAAAGVCAAQQTAEEDIKGIPPAQIPMREVARNRTQGDREFLSARDAEEEEERPAQPPPPVASKEPPRAAVEKPRLSPSEARRIVEGYLAAAEARTPEREVSFYGPQVDYFESGVVTRDAVMRDQQAYYRRWPERSFTLTEPPEIVGTYRGAVSVRFRIRYALRSDKETARGRTENIFLLKRKGDEWKIIGVRERKLDG
jgi:hypothetical protein